MTLIPANSKILIVGGGTGWIIEEVGKIHAAGLNITYVELSANMMALSKKRDPGHNLVTYINIPVQNAVLNNNYDVVITPFLFDNFPPATFAQVFDHLNQLLKPGAIWINTDFQLTGKWWQNPLLKSMYLFFGLLGCMEAKKLSDIKPYFKRAVYTVISQQLFFSEFIATTAYKKG